MFPSLKEMRDDFGMSLHQIKERFPNVTDEDLRQTFGISKEQLKRELRGGKDRPPGGEVTPGGEDPLDFLSEQQDYPSTGIKSKRPLRRRAEIKEEECPMASVQSIRDRLTKVGVVTPTPKVVPSKPTQQINLGPRSEISEKRILEGVEEGKEVELSLGRFYDDTFRPGVPVSGFVGICKYLGKRENGYSQLSSPRRTVVEIDDHLNLRRTEEKGAYSYQRKIRGEVYNSPDLEFRISISEEADVEEPPNFRTSLTRERFRTEFLNKSKTMRVDITMVSQKAKGKVTQSYEVEIELQSNKGKTASLSELINEAKALMMVAGEVSSPERLITRREFSNFITEHNFLLKVPFKNYPASGYWNKPTNLTKMDLLERAHQMAITPKLDGERRLLILTDFGVFVNARPDIYKIGFLGSDKMVGSILDCEYYEKTKTYWVFDVLIYSGVDVRRNLLPDRDQIRKGISISDFKLWDGISVETSKPYFFPNRVDDIYTCAKAASMWQKTLEKSGMQFDGFIFQSLLEYGNPFSRKWKPARLTTIDFLLSPTEKEDTYSYSTFDSKGKRNIPFTKAGVKDTIRYSRPKICGINPDSDFVAECVYIQDRFEVHRERPDRSGANETLVAEGVWRDIIDPISIPAIFGYDMKIMQYAHNRTKEILLKRLFNAEAILDLGTGQGGDLMKWSHAGIKKVFVVEPDPQKIAELKRRYDAKKHPQIEIIKNREGELAKTEDTKVIQKFIGDAPIKGVSAFFSMTFLGGSKDLIQRAADTISSVLTKQGQLFVGIVMDGKQVHKLLDQTEDGKYVASTAVNNKEIFSIKDTGETSEVTSSFTSRKIKVNIPGTFIEDVEEWTFPFDYFTSLMRENGFYLQSEGFLSPNEEDELPLAFTKATGGIFAPKDIQATSKFNNIYNNLPFHAKVFSSLQRYFVFAKGRKREVTGISLPTKTKPSALGERLAGVDLGDLNLEIHHALQDSSAIFNSFLEIYDEEYRDPQSASIEEQQKEVDRLEENAKSSRRTEEDFARARKKIADLESKLESLPQNSALKKQLRESKEDLEKEERNADDRFAAKANLGMGKNKLASAIQHRKLEILSRFRTEMLVGHIKENIDHFRRGVYKKYRSPQDLIKELKDLKKEIPPPIALSIISSFYQKQKMIGVLFNGLSDEVTCFGCPKDTSKGWNAFVIYQTLSGSLKELPADESSSLRKHYYPVFSNSEDLVGIFSSKVSPIKKLVELGCS